MHSSTQLLHRLSFQLLPDLTLALKLIKSRLLLLVKLSKSHSLSLSITPPYDLIRSLTVQQSELIKKYKDVDMEVLQKFKIEWERLFSRVVEMMRLEKGNGSGNQCKEVEEFVREVEGAIYEGVREKEREKEKGEGVDYVKVLAKIYGRGRIMTKELVGENRSEKEKEKEKDKEKKEKGNDRNLTNLNHINQQKSLNFTPNLSFLPPKPLTPPSYSQTLLLFTSLDLDNSFSHNSHLYMLTHQDDTLSQFLLRNKSTASEINTYRKQYTENLTRREKKSVAKKRKLVPVVSNFEATTSSSSRVPSAVIKIKQEESKLRGRSDQNGIHLSCNQTNTLSQKHRPIFFHPNSKSLFSEEPKVNNQSFNLIQSKQIMPKKILFAFNKMVCNSRQEGKGLQFSVRRKGRQYLQVKGKGREQMQEILVEGRKIEEQMGQVGAGIQELRKRVTGKKNSNSYMQR